MGHLNDVWGVTRVLIAPILQIYKGLNIGKYVSMYNRGLIWHSEANTIFVLKIIFYVEHVKEHEWLPDIRKPEE